MVGAKGDGAAVDTVDGYRLSFGIVVVDWCVVENRGVDGEGDGGEGVVCGRRDDGSKVLPTDGLRGRVN